MRHVLVPATLLLTLVLAGCTGPTLQGRIHNDTDEAHHVALIVFPDGSTEPVFRKSSYVAPRSSVGLDGVVADHGAYDVLVTLDNGTHTETTVDLTQEQQRLEVWLRGSGVSITTS